MSHLLATGFYKVPSVIPQLGGYGLLYNWYTTQYGNTFVYDEFGALYNYYAVKYAVNGAHLAPIGWHIPSYTEWITLREYLGGDSVAGGKMKETGTTHWLSPNSGADNSSGFTALPGGYRKGSIYEPFPGFGAIKSIAYFWTSTDTGFSYSRPACITIQYGWANLNVWPTDDWGGWVFQNNGLSVRCVKDSTSLSDGETSIVTDYDGNTYNTICIGTQEWMVENLKVTHYNDGTLIPNLVGQTAWVASTTGAFCYYWANLAPAGWHVTTTPEYISLSTFLGGDLVSAGKMKEMGTVHWLPPNMGADNSSGFSAVGSGVRRLGFFDLKMSAFFQTPNTFQDDGVYANLIYLSTEWDYLTTNWGYEKSSGASIRFTKNTTTLTEGQTGTLVDINGNISPTICRNGKEFSAINCKVTHYNDSTPIPEITDDTAWDAADYGAMCAYNNDWRNV